MNRRRLNKKFKLLKKKKRQFLKLLRRSLKKHWILFQQHWVLNVLMLGAIGAVVLIGSFFVPRSQELSAAGGDGLSCTVATSCASGTVVFEMNATSNSHAGTTAGSSYTQLVCCSGPAGAGLSNSCSGNYATVLRLSGATNAHVEQNNQATAAYDGNDVCLSANTGYTLTVAYQNTNCTGYDTTLASISGTTNAHVGNSTAFTKKVCGSIISPDLSWVTGAADFKIYQSSSLTWDAGTLVCSGTLTDTNADTIGCSPDSIIASTQYRVQVVLKNAGTNLANMDGSSEYVDHKLVKAGWAGTSPTLGSCAFNDFDADDTGSTGCTAAWNATNDVRITETGTGSININQYVLEVTNGTEGYAYLITTSASGMLGQDATSYMDSSIDSNTEDSSKVSIDGPGTAFSTQTGYYIGNGSDSRAITGVGFQPQFIMIKDDTADGTKGVVFKTSSMISENTGELDTANATTTSNIIQSLDSNGFTIGTDADVNTANTRYTWISFAGSTCTSSGTICIGKYSGNGASSQTISTGFQPNLVIIKSAWADAGGGVWRSSAMATGTAQFFSATVEDATSAYFYSLNTSGFTVGNNAAVNTSAHDYFYIAFKKTSDSRLVVGSYTGNGTSQNITTTGLNPQYVMVKKTDTTAAAAVYNLTESNNDYSSSFTDVINSTTQITSLGTAQFSVGAGANTNTSAKNYQFVAFGGATNPTGSGSFTIKTGSYTGTGSSNPITGVGFAPDLVIIKKSTCSGCVFSVFRTSAMAGDSTAYFASALTNFTGGITSLDSDGFTVGTATTVNTASAVYYWEAFGNAFEPQTNSGAADFIVGAYMGNGLSAQNVNRFPFAPDMVAVKPSAAVLGGWRAINNDVGDLTSSFSATAEQAAGITATTTTGFTRGTLNVVNSADTLHWFFAFKSGTAFKYGTYTGNGGTQTISAPNFTPDLVWVKRDTAVAGVFRATANSNSQYFTNGADVSGRITALVSTGFSVGNNTETNTNAATYRYVAFKAAQGFFNHLGNLLSSSIDMTDYSTITNRNALRAVWSYSVPSSCVLTIKFRGTNTGPPTDYTGTTWSTTFTANTASTTTSIDLTGEAFLSNLRFYQYYIDMTACSGDNTSPKLFNVRLDYD